MSCLFQWLYYLISLENNSFQKKQLKDLKEEGFPRQQHQALSIVEASIAPSPPMIITMIIILTITIIIKPSSSSSLGRPACSFHLENGNDCTNPSLSRSQAAVAPLCPPGCHYRKVHLAFEQLLHVEQLEHLQRHGHLEHLHCFCTLSILSTLVWLRSCPRVITCQSVRKADTGQYSLQQQEWFKQG